jgi:asparagine synthase (glutamine-hydrolysing)
LGVRPLYYAVIDHHLVLSTDIRAVLAHPKYVSEPNERHVAELLCERLSNMTDTLYEGVVRLPPAHGLRVEQGCLHTWRFWDVDLSQELQYRDSRDYVEHFGAVFSEAVRCRLRSRCEATVALSGGLDSSLVLATALRHIRGGTSVARCVQPTSLVFEAMDCDESAWIHRVTEHLGVAPRLLQWAPVTWDDMMEEARRTGYLPAQPNTTVDIFARAGLEHVNVLTGAGGDQWMYGRVRYFGDEWRARRYGSLLRNVAEGGGRHLAALARASLSHRARAWSTYVLPRTGEDLEPTWLGHRLHGRLSAQTEPSPPTTLGDLPRAQLSRYATLHNPWEPLSHEALDQAVSGAHLVLAQPFYDPRVVKLVFAIPDAQRWHGADARWLERRIVGSLLPSSVANRRSKAEFTPPFLAQLQRLRSDEQVSLRRLAELGWIDPNMQWHFSNPRFGVDGVTPRVLWRMTALEAWIRAAWN